MTFFNIIVNYFCSFIPCNNIEKVSNTYDGDYSEFSYQYSYDGKWPTERRRVYSDNSLGTTYFYEYVK